MAVSPIARFLCCGLLQIIQNPATPTRPRSSVWYCGADLSVQRVKVAVTIISGNNVYLLEPSFEGLTFVMQFQRFLEGKFARAATELPLC